MSKPGILSNIPTEIKQAAVEEVLQEHKDPLYASVAQLQRRAFPRPPVPVDKLIGQALNKADDGSNLLTSFSRSILSRYLEPTSSMTTQSSNSEKVIQGTLNLHLQHTFIMLLLFNWDNPNHILLPQKNTKSPNLLRCI